MKQERQFEINEALEFVMTKFLGSYLESLHFFSVKNLENIIEIQGQNKKEDISRFVLIRLGINDVNGEILISNIFIPKEDRRQGIGLKLILMIYLITKRFGFTLSLVDMTDHFYEKMLKRGALETNYPDALQIVDETNLE